MLLQMGPFSLAELRRGACVPWSSVLTFYSRVHCTEPTGKKGFSHRWSSLRWCQAKAGLADVWLGGLSQRRREKQVIKHVEVGQPL